MILYSSSTNDSDDDSGEDDVIWNSYRKRMKSHSLSSSTDSQESSDTVSQGGISSNYNKSVDTNPLEDMQSWEQMLENVTSSVQNVTLSVQQQVASVVVSSSSELDDKAISDDLSNNGPSGKPLIFNKLGKKAQVRKHAKKKKKTQDEKKRETSKTKQKVVMKKQFQDSELCSDVKSKDSVMFEDDNVAPTVTPTQYQEDINKIKMRLEAQICARKGFGVLSSQEVIYDKV